MVRVLANGDIVSNDDPRARAQDRTTRTATSQPHRGRGVNAGIPNTNQNMNDNDYRNAAPHQQVNIFQTINERLLAFGIPQFNIGGNVIEPIVTVGILLAMFFFGLPGLIFGLILFAVSKWSQDGPPDFVAQLFGMQNQANQPDRNHNNRDGGGGGHRLGNN